MRASLARMGRLNIWNYLLGRAGRHYTEARTRLRTGPPGIRPVGRSLELWNRIQFLECRGERIRKTPDRSRSELLVLRLEVRGVPTANHLEPLQCVHFRVQGAGSYSTVQGYGQAGRIPGSPVLAVVLACGACIGRPPFF